MREFALLEHVFKANAQLPSHVTIPPGDDMGAVQVGSATILVAVDQVVDGVHVDLAGTDLARVGRKALTRNLSDIAAMAARPIGAVVAASLPRDFGADRADALFDAMRQTAQQYHCPLIGGDITIWDHRLLLAVTVLAEPGGIEPVLRSGALPGDVVCVTGQLGGSLQAMAGRVHHLDFEPRIALARELAGRFNLSAMIDLSDGLGRDLGHICRMSGVQAEIDRDALPISPAAVQASQTSRLPPWQHALCDGEDYELCFTLSAQQAVDLPDHWQGVPLTRIGWITGTTDRPAVIIRHPDGSRQTADHLGWEHHGP